MIDFDKLKEAPAETVAKHCSINLANLEETMQNHPSLYAYAVASYETARAAEARAKWNEERVRAEVFNQIQDEEPGLAIGRTERRVDDHADVVDASAKRFRLAREVAALKALVRGLEHRRDMIQQIAARQREELKSY